MAAAGPVRRRVRPAGPLREQAAPPGSGLGAETRCLPSPHGPRNAAAPVPRCRARLADRAAALADWARWLPALPPGCRRCRPLAGAAARLPGKITRLPGKITHLPAKTNRLFRRTTLSFVEPPVPRPGHLLSSPGPPFPFCATRSEFFGTRSDFFATRCSGNETILLSKPSPSFDARRRLSSRATRWFARRPVAFFGPPACFFGEPVPPARRPVPFSGRRVSRRRGPFFGETNPSCA
jgi:hypothetical protein